MLLPPPPRHRGGADDIVDSRSPPPYRFMAVADADGWELSHQIVLRLKQLNNMLSPSAAGLVVLVTVDDAQVLDEVAPHGDRIEFGGAQFALEALRHLQVRVAKVIGNNRVVLLPVAIGHGARTFSPAPYPGTHVALPALRAAVHGCVWRPCWILLAFRRADERKRIGRRTRASRECRYNTVNPKNHARVVNDLSTTKEN